MWLRFKKLFSPTIDLKNLRLTNAAPGAWINGAMVWIYFLTGLFLFHITNGKLDLRVFLSVAAIGYSILLHFTSREFFLTETDLIKRELFPFVRVRYFRLADIASVGRSYLWQVKISFKDGSKLRVPSLYWRRDLIEAIRPEERQMLLDCGSLLAFEIQRRQIKNSTHTDFTLPRAGFGPIQFLAVGMAIIIASLSWINSETNQLYAQLDFKNEKEISYHQLKSVFFFYRGERFKNLEKRYLKECEAKKDFTCRLAGNLLKIDNRENEAIKYYKVACSAGDIAGCGNIYRSRITTSDDRAPAAAAIDEYCENGKGDKRIDSHCSQYRKWTDNIKAGKPPE